MDDDWNESPAAFAAEWLTSSQRDEVIYEIESQRGKFRLTTTALKAQAAEIATLRAELAAAREALETAERVMLWAERRMACEDYAKVIANDARNIRAMLAAAPMRGEGGER